MSKEIVKSKKSIATFQDIEEFVVEAGVAPLPLDASLPMPSDFKEDWEASKNQFVASLTSNKNPMMAKLGRLVGFSERAANFLSWYTESKATAAGMVLVALGAATGIVFGTEPMMAADDALSGFPFWLAAIVTGTLGAPVGLILAVVAAEPVGTLAHRVLPMVENIFNQCYRDRVGRWAQERYGLQIGEAWATTPVGAIAEDIIYLGVQNGQKVYCFETEAGWIIGYRDGTELPVLAERKELVKA